MRNIFKIIGTDGSEEFLSAEEISLKEDVEYTEAEVIEAACASKDWNENQISTVE